MTSSWDGPTNAPPTGAPPLDRRALERLAVGAPPPAPAVPPAPIRAIERGATVRTGWPLRALPPGHRPRRRAPARPVAPEISIGRPRERSRPAHDLSAEPLYLLVPGEESRRSGIAAAAALQAAGRFSEGRPVLLVDLDPEFGHLAGLVGARGEEGIAEALAFDLSLGAVGFLLENGVRFVPLGTLAGPSSSLLDDAGWSRALAVARRRGWRVLVYTPVGDTLGALAHHAGAALLLATPTEETRLSGDLPPTLPIVGVIEPPAILPEPLARAAARDRRPTPTPAPSAAPTPPPSPTPGAADARPGGTLEDVLRELEGDTSTAPTPQATRPHVAASPAAQPTAEPFAPGPAPAHPLAGDIEPETALDRAAEEARLAGAPPSVRLPEPPMQAPTARGLTLGEWLEAESERIRILSRSPSSVLVFDAAETAEPVADGGVETVEAPAEREPAEVPEPWEAPSPVEARPRPEPGPAPAAQLPPPEAALTPFGTPRYSVPRPSAGRERATRIAAVLILAYWTYYIVWRWTSTLNYDALWFSVPLALAETWGWATAFFLVFTVWRLNHRTVPPAPPGLAVDVFITTYDEPLEVIRRTTISAREIRYPHRTFVLDDGRREEIRAMAGEMGVGYITRGNNDHAKAGNLNNGLRFTSGDFVLLLDADHAPLPDILDRLLGFFEDEKVALVQTPQDFYNIDSFTSNVDEDTQRIWEEQKLFFSVIQPGKDSWNSAFFCGSCAVVRRRALEEIGGFSVRSVTEDIETSLLLHARGWKSVYHGESLAYGLAANSAAAFQIQHGRWAQGAMQVLRTFNPLTYPGLTLAQRIGYFYSLSAYVVGLQKLIFYGAPVVFFLTGVLPIRALDSEFLVRFVPYLLLSILLVEMLSRGLGFTWIAERYQMAKFWTYTRALPTYLTKQRIRFRVTPKGPGHVPFATYAPHFTLMVVTVVSVYWATIAHSQGWIDYTVPGWRSLAFQLNFLWASINFVLAAYVVSLSVRLQQQRQDHRFSDRFPIHLRPIGRDGQLGERQLALTENLNAAGASFRSVSRFEVGTELRITLLLSTGEVDVIGTVVHVRPEPEPEIPAFIHGVEFRDVPLPVRDAIEIHCTHHAVPFKQMQYSSVGRVFSASSPPGRERGESRAQVRLPTWVILGDSPGEPVPEEARKQNVAFLEEIGPSGASLIMNEAVPPGTAIIFEVPGTEIRGEGRTTYSHALETPIGVRFVVGVRIDGAVATAAPRSLYQRLRGRGAALGAVLACAAALWTAPLAAQIVVYGTAEADSRDQSLLLIGATVHPTSPGWGPYAGVMAYRLDYPAPDDGVTTDALAPSLGLRHAGAAGQVQLGIGYLFLASEPASTLGAPGGSREGVLVSGLTDHRAGRLTAQLAASYNWGDDYVWIRGRGARLLGWDPGAGDAALGAEAIFQGGGSGGGYHSFQVAPTLAVPVAASLSILAAAGWKTDDLAHTRGGGFPYVKAEFVYLPD